MPISQKLKNKLDPLDKRILNRLQEDIPFVERPWEAVACELHIKEDFLLKRIAFLKKRGIIRRISAVFSPRKINFASTLVAVKTAPNVIEKVAKKINAYPEVTHNYQRDAEYNLWFTLIAKNRRKITQILNKIKRDKNVRQLAEFPTTKLFKINVKFRV